MAGDHDNEGDKFVVLAITDIMFEAETKIAKVLCEHRHGDPRFCTIFNQHMPDARKLLKELARALPDLKRETSDAGDTTI